MISIAVFWIFSRDSSCVYVQENLACDTDDRLKKQNSNEKWQLKVNTTDRHQNANESVSGTKMKPRTKKTAISRVNRHL